MSFENILERILPALKIMWQGMAGILVVMGILAAVVVGLAKAGNKKK